MRKFLIFSGLGCSLLAGAVIAGPMQYRCPQELSADAVKVQSPAAGWKSFVGAPLYLSNAAAADGPPERLGVLRGEEGKPTKTSWTQKYNLEGAYPEGKWLRCDYGAFGEISLGMRLPDGTAECTVTGRKGVHAGENTFEIICN